MEVKHLNILENIKAKKCKYSDLSNGEKRDFFSENYDYKLFFERFDNIPILLVTTLKEYIDIINCILSTEFDTRNSNGKPMFFFRGISNLEHLHSKIFRNESKQYINQEFAYLEKFEQNAMRKFPQFNYFLDFVAMADHYDIPTRFIDWSSSPFVATLFAYGGEMDDNHNFNGILVKSRHNFAVLKTLPIVGDNLSDYPFLSHKYAAAKQSFTKFIKLIKKTNIDNVKDWLVQTHLNIFKNELNDCDHKYIFEYICKLFCETSIRFERSLIHIKKDATKDEISNFWERNSTILPIIGDLFKGKNVILDTSISNDRLQRQFGYFEMDYKNNFVEKNAFCLILLSAPLKKQVKNYINGIGINEYVLFDDIVNISRLITNKIQKQNINLKKDK